LDLKNAGYSGPILAQELRAQNAVDKQRRARALAKRRRAKRVARQEMTMQVPDSELDDKLQQMIRRRYGHLNNEPQVAKPQASRTPNTSMADSSMNSMGSMKSIEMTRTTGRKKPHPKAYLIPTHQRRVMLADPHYTPDREFCSSEWPIPGMQGARTPFKQPPYGAVKIDAQEMVELAADIHDRRDEVMPDSASRIEATRTFFKKNMQHLPKHQSAIMEYPNYPANNRPYQPRPETGLSLWPIPGTQGEFTPLRCLWVGGPKALIEYPKKPAADQELIDSKTFVSANDSLRFHSESGMNYNARPAQY